MRTLSKYAAAATLIGALALVATPGQARWNGHHGGWHGHRGGGAAAVIGFGAGALLGAAAANAANDGYYGSDYGYAYEPADGPYGYAPAPDYYRGAPSCAVDMGNGRYDYSSC
jgi:hypothetical protein